MNKENSVESMNTKGVKGYESISWAPHPPRFSPPPSLPPHFPPTSPHSPPPPQKKRKKKNLWSPFSYKLPVISSPTRTLMRQRYIGFAVPSFFFLLCYRYSKCTKKKTPLQKEWSFWLCCQAKKTLNCHGEIFIFARCISVVRVLKITLIFARCDVRR